MNILCWSVQTENEPENGTPVTVGENFNEKKT